MNTCKTYILCCICMLFSIANAAEQAPRASSSPGLLDRVKDKATDILRPSPKSDQDAEIQHLKALLHEQTKENQRLQDELRQRNAELQRLREAQIALQEIARTLNVSYHPGVNIPILRRMINERLQKSHYLPSYRLSKEQLQLIKILLDDEPGILQIIQKYHMFINGLDGQKIIVLP